MQRHGETSAWETVGVFRIADGKIAECWVLPYDLYSFDESGRRPSARGSDVAGSVEIMRRRECALATGHRQR